MQRKRKNRFLAVVVVAAIQTACGAAASYQMAHTGYAEAGFSGAPAPEPAHLVLRAEQRGVRDKDAVITGDQGGNAELVQRMIIYTGSFVVDVYDIKEAQGKLIEFVKGEGGYLQQMSSYTVVLRIPADKFALVEPKLKQLGRVDDTLTDIRAQDITEEYYDLQLQLKTRKEYLESLRKLLDGAGKLEEKLAVQKEIARVVDELERIEGRLRLLSQQVALATVTVTFRLAHSGTKRTFKLPWEWLDELGLEYLIQ